MAMSDMNVIVSVANQALVVPATPGVAQMFPNALPLPGTGNVVLHHGLREKKVLEHLGYEVPNPILIYYDFNGGTPFEVQKKTIKLLTEHPRCYVLNHMGTGKTKTALWAWDALNKAGAAKKLLVVAPLSTLRFVWQREAFVTVPGRKVVVLHGTKQDRLDALAQDADIYIINHDGLKVIESELQARADIDTLVLDELAVYRNNSDRSKRMRKFARRFNYVWGMTGAPMPNEPTDVWAQCQIITPNTVPQYRSHCRDMLMTRISQYIWKPKPDAVVRAFQMMQPSVRYSLDDVVELPALIERTIDVELSREQRTAYDKISKEMATMVRDKMITAVNAGAAMNKLIQIAGGWVYTKAPEFVRLDPSPRILAAAELIQSAEHKVIMFIPYRHAIEGISAIFKQVGGLDHDVVHGDTGDRETIFNRFQYKDSIKLLLAHPGCIHHGLTLTAADTIIWYLPITSLDIYDQANARIRRVGQQHKQQVIHLQGTTTEKKIYRMLREHQKIQDSFLQLVEEASEDLRE